MSGLVGILLYGGNTMRKSLYVFCSSVILLLNDLLNESIHLFKLMSGLKIYICTYIHIYIHTYSRDIFTYACLSKTIVIVCMSLLIRIFMSVFMNKLIYSQFIVRLHNYNEYVHEYIHECIHE